MSCRRVQMWSLSNEAVGEKHNVVKNRVCAISDNNKHLFCIHMCCLCGKEYFCQMKNMYKTVTQGLHEFVIAKMNLINQLNLQFYKIDKYFEHHANI